MPGVRVRDRGSRHLWTARGRPGGAAWREGRRRTGYLHRLAAMVRDEGAGLRHERQRSVEGRFRAAVRADHETGSTVVAVVDRDAEVVRTVHT
jgi:hypothetical protein